MGLYQHVGELWTRPKENLAELWRERLIAWRSEPATIRIDHPTRLDRAHALGYKAKLGYIMVRQRVSSGPHGRQRGKGRKPKNIRKLKILHKNYKLIAEERAQQVYPNCEVLNSYFVAKDGKNYWFEVILVDRSHPAILADERINWIALKKGRVFRGLTSAGQKVRGLQHKGLGAEKARPSRRAHSRRL